MFDMRYNLIQSMCKKTQTIESINFSSNKLRISLNNLVNDYDLNQELRGQVKISTNRKMIFYLVEKNQRTLTRDSSRRSMKLWSRKSDFSRGQFLAWAESAPQSAIKLYVFQGENGERWEKTMLLRRFSRLNTNKLMFRVVHEG